MGTFEPHEDFPAIVIDNGSSTCRAGIAGEDVPSCIFSSLVGKRKNLLGKDEFFVGSQLQENRELLALKYPIENGIVVDWDDMMKVWDYALYSSLSIKPEEHPILMSEPPFNPRGNREKMAQVLFEKYQSPAVFCAFQPMLVLAANGMHHGLIVTVGDGHISIVPIYEGHVFFHAISKTDFGGRDLTKYLQQLLYKKGYSFTTSAEMEIVRDMKEKLCCVRDDLSRSNISSAGAISFKLPDGTNITLDEERFMCPEILFKPDGTFHRGRGLVDTIVDTINYCDIESRQDTYHMIILSGGSTLFPGFPERVKSALNYYPNVPFRPRKIWAAPERAYQTWIGGSILASLSSFSRVWITKQEYEEYGLCAMNIMCYGCG